MERLDFVGARFGEGGLGAEDFELGAAACAEAGFGEAEAGLVDRDGNLRGLVSLENR